MTELVLATPQPQQPVFGNVEMARKFQESAQYMSGSGVTFRHPMEYVEPLMQIGGIVDIQLSNPVNVSKDDNTITAYSRFSVKTKLYSNDEFSGVVGMLVALDIPKPIIKVFSGQDVHACTNLHIFRANKLMTIDLLGGKNNHRDVISQFSDQSTGDWRLLNEIHARLSDKQIHYPTVFGKMLDQVIKSKDRIGTTTLLHGLQAMNDDRSRYYVGGESTSAWNVLNAITNDLKKTGDDFRMPEKSFSAYQILESTIS